MSISQYTLALIAMCLNQAVTPNNWHVSVTSPVQALQGMSVIFNCSFQYPYENILPSHIIALWLEDPCDENSQILYSSEKDSSEGVNFIGDLGRKNCSLQIHDVKITNSKKYCFRFEIQNKDKWTGKPGVTLIVYAHPTKPTLSLSPELVEGVRTTLTCSSSNIEEHVKSTLKWYGLDEKIAEESLFISGNRMLKSTVNVTLSHKDHNKVIKCSVISSEYSFSAETQEILKVKYAPKNITIQVEDRSQLEIKEGDKVSLTCASNSNPEATYSWYKRDKGHVKDFDSKNGTLLFQSISQSDSGFYSCTATNYLGNQSSEVVEILVQYAPRNTTIYVENRSQMEIKEDDNISLLCASHSYPEATYTWHRRKEDNGQTMAFNSTRGTLVFHSISRRDSGLVPSYHKSLQESIVAILFLLAGLLWTQRKNLIRGKKVECDSQPVTHTEMENLPEIKQTSNSVVGDVYGNLCMSKSGEGKPKLSRKYSGDALHYASLRFFVKHKGPEAARPNSEQAKPSDAQVTAPADGAVYENMAMFNTTREEPGAANNDPGETTLYACIKVDNLQDNSK
ncbi:B-cell receptor CD22-like [Pristis pectinata]|uniref:B-cell receptor CD22-like n=1 Tax=Pristis pectinata TaxID=685728 RepID=UPI00223DDED0|nr:B-cell receptor CD22-like [Pristis pectinata]